MNAMKTGILAGGVLGAAGVAWLLSDSRSRHKMARDGAKVVKKAEKMMGL